MTIDRFPVVDPVAGEPAILEHGAGRLHANG